MGSPPGHTLTCQYYRAARPGELHAYHANIDYLFGARHIFYSPFCPLFVDRQLWLLFVYIHDTPLLNKQFVSLYTPNISRSIHE